MRLGNYLVGGGERLCPKHPPNIVPPGSGAHDGENDDGEEARQGGGKEEGRVIKNGRVMMVKNGRVIKNGRVLMVKNGWVLTVKKGREIKKGVMRLGNPQEEEEEEAMRRPRYLGVYKWGVFLGSLFVFPYTCPEPFL